MRLASGRFCTTPVILVIILHSQSITTQQVSNYILTSLTLPYIFNVKTYFTVNTHLIRTDCWPMKTAHLPPLYRISDPRFLRREHWITQSLYRNIVIQHWHPAHSPHPQQSGHTCGLSTPMESETGNRQKTQYVSLSELYTHVPIHIYAERMEFSFGKDADDVLWRTHSLLCDIFLKHI